MAAPASQTQWYLARDGQQYGPLTDVELAKFIELGHMQPSDLLWREGFPDWRPAMVVFPNQLPAARQSLADRLSGATAPSAGRSAARAAAQPAQGRGRETQSPESDAGAFVPAEPRRRGGALKRLLRLIILLGAIGAAGYFAYPYRARLGELAGSLQTLLSGSFLDNVDRKSLEAPPLAGFKGTAETIDTTLQATALWRVIKREFPDWYSERLKEAATMAGQSKDDTAIGQQIARSLVALRRQQVENALSASLPRLKSVAVTFYNNLVELKKHSTDACYGFISQGEASPVVVTMLQGSPHTAHLQAQMTAVFEAIGEGRKSPRVYPQPRKTDYDLLAAELTKLGWSQSDMQLFSDERALARASPEKVCQMVHDWFAAQLAVKDSDVQLRLLVDSLRPVVAG